MPEPTIHPAAPANDLAAHDLLIRPGPDGAVSLDPARAGWRYLSYATAAVPTAGLAIPAAEGVETCLVVLDGHDVTIVDDGNDHRWRLPGRADVFADLPSALWLPNGRALTVRVGAAGSAGRATVAIARAPRSERDGVATEAILVTPPDVVVETRGAGNASRQINHVIAPSFPADRLEVVEVLTPSGNWSSWPPHKHDVDDMPTEAVLEEIYHYRFRRPAAWAIQRVYRADRSRDALLEVRGDDVVIVPDGYHPFTATHGDDAYYLNALAGDRRTMACSFDPDLDWVRETWPEMELDPRIPLVPPRSAAG
ncbi:MAG: 5-deoxy-glucuronate isomerase [Chloroflexi bacterium]|nr:5-deoxy-glucuronate isomerase [Chloroflexota bacterium]